MKFARQLPSLPTMTETALFIGIIALALAGAGLYILQHRYKLIRRRLHMLDLSAKADSQFHRQAYARLMTASLASQGKQPRFPIMFNSEFGEDLTLLELFDGKLSGFYIECGAHDGFIASVTYSFEAIGWTGLLVEPVPRTNAAAKRRRPHSTVIQAVMSKRGSSGTIKFAEVTTNGKHENASRSYVAGKEPPKQVTKRDDTTIHDVKVMTMDDALAGMTPLPSVIDFAVIDVEGHEMDLFDGWDLDKWKPRALMVEEYPPGKRSELLEMLQRRGYKVVHTVGWNKLLVRNDDAALLDRCRRLQWIREEF